MTLRQIQMIGLPDYFPGTEKRTTSIDDSRIIKTASLSGTQTYIEIVAHKGVTTHALSRDTSYSNQSGFPMPS